MPPPAFRKASRSEASRFTGVQKRQRVLPDEQPHLPERFGLDGFKGIFHQIAHDGYRLFFPADMGVMNPRKDYKMISLLSKDCEMIVYLVLYHRVLHEHERRNEF